MADISQDLLFKIGADVVDFQTKIGQIESTVSSMSTNLRASASGASAGFSSMSLSVHDVGAATEKLASTVATAASGVMGLAKSFFTAASNAAMTRLRLENVYRSAGDAAKALEAIKAIEPFSPYTMGDLTKAAINLRMLGNDAQKFLPLANELASFMGVNIVDASLTMSKALAGSTRGWVQLRNEFGITGAKLKEFGAVLTNDGNIAAGVQNVQRNADALAKYIDRELGGSAAKFSQTFEGKMSSLNTQIGRLKSSLGKELLDPMIGAVGGLINLTEQLNNTDAATKRLISTIVVAGAGVGIFATGLLRITGFLKNWGTFVTSMTGGIGTIAAAFKLSAVDKYLQAAQAGQSMWTRQIIMTSAAATSLNVIIATIPVAIGLAVAGLQRMQSEVKKADWELRQGMMGEQTMANRAIGIAKAYDLKGKSASEMAAAYKKAGMSYDDVIKATVGMQQLIAGAKTDEEKKRYDELRQSLRAVAQEYKTVGKSAAEMATEQNEVTETTAKEVEHRLAMGEVGKRQAAEQYNSVITGLRSQLALVQGADEESVKAKKKIEEDLWTAEERQKKLRDEAAKDEADKSKKSTEAAKKAAEDKKKIHDKYLDDVTYWLTNLDKELEKGITSEDQALRELKKVEKDLKSDMTGRDRYSKEYQGAQSALQQVQAKIQSLEVKTDNVTITPAQGNATTTTPTATTGGAVEKAAGKIQSFSDDLVDREKSSAQRPSNVKSISDYKSINDFWTVPSFSTVTESKPETLTTSAGPSLNEELNNRMAAMWAKQNKAGAKAWELLSPAEVQTQIDAANKAMSPTAITKPTVGSEMGKAGLTSTGQFQQLQQFADALGKGLKIDITVNGQNAGSTSLSAGQAAVKAASQTNYSPEQASGLNVMPTAPQFGK